MTSSTSMHVGLRTPVGQGMLVGAVSSSRLPRRITQHLMLTSGALDLGAHLVRVRTVLVMGMFDEVYSYYPLPIPAAIPTHHHAAVIRELAEQGLQTKDLDCLLARYDITPDGRLLEVTRRGSTWQTSLLGNFENAGEHGDTCLDADDLSSDDDAEIEYTDTKFHGRLHLHAIFFADDAGVTEIAGLRTRVLGPDFDGEAYNITYTLKFTDGTLVDVEECTATPLRRQE